MLRRTVTRAALALIAATAGCGGGDGSGHAMAVAPQARCVALWNAEPPRGPFTEWLQGTQTDTLNAYVSRHDAARGQVLDVSDGACIVTVTVSENADPVVFAYTNRLGDHPGGFVESVVPYRDQLDAAVTAHPNAQLSPDGTLAVGGDQARD